MKTKKDHVQLMRMISGYWISQMIYAAAHFGIADLLKSGARSTADLASETETNEDALYRLLRALASVGIFQETEPRTFELTGMAELLRSDVPGSKRAVAMMSGEEHFLSWSEIVYSIQTGEKAFDKIFGQPIFEFLAENPRQAKIFDEAMTGIHGQEADAILNAYDFSGINTIADIGGGNGSKLIAILQKYPSLKGMLMDLPHVVDRAKERISDAGLQDRCEAIEGDFFQSVPAGADAYMMRHIIHDWDDEKSLTILRNCHQALPQQGKLLVVESVIPAGNQPHAGKLLDLTMLLIPGGKERTAEEYRSLFLEAGFELTQIVETTQEINIIEGVKQ